MKIEKIVEILKDLPENSGLKYEENWDDLQEVQKWRLETLKAIEEAIVLLTAGNIVGKLELGGKIYKITT